MYHLWSDQCFYWYLCRLFDLNYCSNPEGSHLSNQHWPYWVPLQVSTGEDGSPQMALEDLAMFQAMTNCTIFSLSDTVLMDYAVFLVVSIKWMCYIWTSCPETAIIYDPQESFEIGQAKIVRHIANDKVTVIGAGVTLHES